MNPQELMSSKSVKVGMLLLGALVLVLAGFAGGLAVGSRKARFSSAFAENYERNFLRGPHMMDGRMKSKHDPRTQYGKARGEMYRNGHGVVGDVLAVGDGTLVIKDAFGNENTITLDEHTLLKSGRDRMTLTDLKVGDRIAVIGEPSSTGTVDAHFIRVLSVPNAQ